MAPVILPDVQPLVDAAIVAYDRLDVKGKRVGHTGDIAAFYGKAFTAGFRGNAHEWIRTVLAVRTEREKAAKSAAASTQQTSDTEPGG